MRMPIGVPVVRPSNTPERIRTRSASWRWLTKCEVPVRRRSTSCWMSASVSGSPGGQPSTMQPMAGPWLSPKVVTVKSLPMLLPDMSMMVCLQLLAREQEHPAPAALELEPHERQPPPHTAHGLLGVADLDDEQPPRSQVSASLCQDDAHRVEPGPPRRERHAWLVPILRRQTRELARTHVGRIGDDDIVGGASECAEVIRFEQPHATREALAPQVVAGHLECRSGDVDGIDSRPRQGARTRDGDAAGAGAHIEHAPHAPRLDPGREAPLDQLGDRRARDEHACIDPDGYPGELRDAGEIRGRHALADAARDELARA